MAETPSLHLPPDHPGNHPDPSLPVVTAATDLLGPYLIAPHRHRRAQLVYAIEGVMTVTTETGTWVVPPQQAVWVPAGTEHAVRCDGPLSMRSLYVHPLAALGLPRGCQVVAVPDLLRELIRKAVGLWAQDGRGASYRRLVQVILDELAALEPAPLDLPRPRDPRLRLITDALLLDPAEGQSLAVWGRQVGASARTLARLFQRETGLGFARWRQRRRLLAAVARLGAGEPVTRVALDLGYRSPSAFVAMFRRSMGSPPARYFRHHAVEGMSKAPQADGASPSPGPGTRRGSRRAGTRPAARAPTGRR